MHPYLRCFAGVTALVLGNSLAAQKAGSPTAGPSPAFSEEQVLEFWGWHDAELFEVDHAEFSPAERAAFFAGMNEAFQGRPMPYLGDYHAVDPDIRLVAKARRADYRLSVTRRHEGEAEEFFGRLRKDPSVVALPSGIFYRILKPGTGPLPKPEQTVSLHYTGRLIDGTEFIQFGPLDWVLVPNHEVCRGWFEGVQKINKGGVIELYVPPPLPEKLAGLMGIPPGSAMTFEVDALNIKDTTSENLADALLPPAPEPPPDPPSGLTVPQIIESWGFFTGRRAGLSDLGFGDAELASFSKGVGAAIDGRPSPEDAGAIGPILEAFIRSRQEKARITLQRKSLARAAVFFSELRQRPGVVGLPDGLCYEIEAPGAGPLPKPGQVLNVTYSGRLLDGGEFDHSDGIADIPLGSSVFGTGWDEGMQKIGKGGAIKLYIPSHLGYGDEPITGVPANSTLIMEVKLLGFRNSPPAAHP